jgi:beta-carotene hydroxylase
MVERENAVQAEGVEERRAESTPKTEKHDSTKGSFMRLRHQADVRALVWALLLFPAVPALGYARPELALLLLPASLYLAYCAGVLTHYHNHCPVFLARRLNQLYGAWLSLFYGYPIFVWIPTHNQNHHRFVDGPNDATRTTRDPRPDGLFKLLVYPVRSALWQQEGIKRYIASARAEHPERYREILAQYAVVFGGHAALLALGVFLHGPEVGLRTYVLMSALPAIFASWSMMFTNYVQHVGCDPASPDDHSRNFTSPLQNWLVFDAGFHTVHHDMPGAHWSRLRALHEWRAGRIDPKLNEHSIFGFCLKRYVAAPLLRSAASASQ